MKVLLINGSPRGNGNTSTPMKSEKTELEKMRAGELYSFADPEVRQSVLRAQRLCARLQTMTLGDAGYRATMQELIPDMAPMALLCPPFHCDHGHGISIGEGTFVNYNCTMLDGGRIRIGRHCEIGPNCQLYTPVHPFDYVERRRPVESTKPITIGDDCWLGGGVIVLPGVTIGARTIIGAGSVVTKDIPEDSVAVGNPCRVIRRLASKQSFKTHLIE